MKNLEKQSVIKAFEQIKIHIPKKLFYSSINRNNNLISKNVKLLYLKSKEQKEEDKKRKEYEDSLKQIVNPKIISKEEIDFKKIKKFFLKKSAMYKSLSNQMLLNIIFENKLFNNYILNNHSKQHSINLNTISSNNNQCFEKKHSKINTFSFTNHTSMFVTSINTTNQNIDTNYNPTLTYSNRNSLKKKFNGIKKNNIKNKTNSLTNFEQLEKLTEIKNSKNINLYKNDNLKKIKENFTKFKRNPKNLYDYQKSKNKKSIEIFSYKNRYPIIKLINKKNNRIFYDYINNKKDLTNNQMIKSSYYNLNKQKNDAIEKMNEIEKYIDYKKEHKNFENEILELYEKNRKNKLLYNINDEFVFHNYNYILDLYGLNHKKDKKLSFENQLNNDEDKEIEGNSDSDKNNE